ncbi:FGGY-family carbohydrate kinase [Rubellimicrobium sp. CFH 75288]|uniref:xylulokinase n=1 Tax=Rubellimicrobium sp. CFH 75288 TaxID=2697034 RepID=UPI00141313A6|nr:FGGY family carbohydrate kinase [Rubellimicrobium sp. CFH 75288]NAZ36343.1 pentose kinase [Rubellimicrobium sp. CFH 75288]
MRDLALAVDVGTGSVRVALVDRTGRLLAIRHREHDQIVPRHGWSEQRPADWWEGAVEAIRAVLSEVEGAANRVAALCACGQMHGSVLVDADGRLTRETALLWNDKRTQPQVEAFAARADVRATLDRTANWPAPAWPAFKLLWLMENDPDAVERASHLLMPKDWINFRLTGQRAQDRTEGSMSFLMDWRTRGWSASLGEMTGVPMRLLPALRDPADVLGALTPEAAHTLGLPAGLPVAVGAGDYPASLLGSGVTAPGLASDVTGTSTILTILHDEPVLAEGLSNVLAPTGHWGSLTLLDAGGDAVRWARRAFHDNRRSYAELAEAAERAEAGAGGLLFLPFLSGERFGRHPNSRAQFFGLTAAHGLADLHRAVLEGVAFSVRHRLEAAQGGHGRPERVVAAGGGARHALWLRIKASVYRVPFVLPEEPECGVVGAAALAFAAHDGEAPAALAARMVRWSGEIAPDPHWAELYDRMMPLWADLYTAVQPFYDRLDALTR